MPEEGAKLDFAYKYPFTKEAKDMVESEGATKIDEKLLKAGKTRVQAAIDGTGGQFSKTNDVELKQTYLMSYVYARMLVSATANRTAMESFAVSEARRSSAALDQDDDNVLFRVAKELKFGLEGDANEFRLPFNRFLAFATRTGLHLSQQSLEKGVIFASRKAVVKLAEEAIRREVKKGLPIDRTFLPKEVIAMARQIKVPEVKMKSIAGVGRYAWIETLLNTPIADVRHRAINLILAPYLTNVRGLDEDKAAEVIINYIERCRTLNPDTKINQTYIRYQCKYAKNKGMRPLSRSRAKELLGGIIEFGD